jgi:hypothetical protein
MVHFREVVVVVHQDHPQEKAQLVLVDQVEFLLFTHRQLHPQQTIHFSHYFSEINI